MKFRRFHSFSTTALLVLLLAAPVVGQPFEEELSLDLTAQVNRTHLLTPAASTLTEELLVDSAEAVRLIFASPSKTLEIELLSPAGDVISLGAPDTPQALSRIFPDPADPANTGANYLFVLNDPVAGAWQYTVTETLPLAAPRAVLFTLTSSSPLRVGLIGGGDSYRVDREVRLALVGSDGSGVLTNLSVDATLTEVDGNLPPTSIDFRDDGKGGDVVAGDGLYTASFQPGVPGHFQVTATIQADDARGISCERTTEAVFRVEPVRATLSGLFADRGIDLDADGLLDQIGVTPALEVFAEGDYRLAVTLEGSNGATLTAHRNLKLALGVADPEVLFRAQDIKNHLAVDGPYHVLEARLEALASDPVATADAVFHLGDTAAYLLSELEREPIEYLGSGSALGVDLDGNGKFDVLDVSLDVDFLAGGFYEWSARLVDRHGGELGLAAGNSSFAAGSAALELRFDGFAIGENAVNGPYFVRNLILFGAGESLTVDAPLTTLPFNVLEFEGFTGVALEIAGSCPGEVAIQVSRLTPGGKVLILRAAAEGTSMLSGGPCSGTATQLDQPGLFAERLADKNGELVIDRKAGAQLCGQVLQAIDTNVCLPSNATAFP